MLAGDKEESPVADRTKSRYRLHARYFNSQVVKHFAVWSLIPSSLKADADKREFLSTKLPVAGWDRVTIFHCPETQELLRRRWVLSARLQPDQDPAIFIGEIEEQTVCCMRRGGNPSTRRICLAALWGQPPPIGNEFIMNNLQGSK